MNPQQIIRYGTLGAAAGVASTVLAAGGVLAAQLVAARSRPSLDPRTAPDLAPEQGPERGPLLRLVVLGDSVAAGIGADRTGQSLAGRVTQALVDAGYRVQARSVAVPNSRSVDLKIQASRALITSEADPYDLALIVIGAMDVCSWRSRQEVENATYRAVAALVTRGVRVVLTTTPDLGSAPCVRQPLRSIWGLRSRGIAAAQKAGAERAGAEVVDLVEATGTSFAADRGLYSEDGFHPSADGHRIMADALVPVVRATARVLRPIA